MFNKQAYALKKRTIFIFGGLIFLLSIISFANFKCREEFSFKTWEFVLTAMQQEDIEQLQKLSTEKGYDSLIMFERVQSAKVFLRVSADLWVESKMEWEEINENMVELRVGDVKVSTFIFIKDSCTWKIDQFLVAA